jgi:AraC-like DNA-binding protein
MLNKKITYRELVEPRIKSTPQNVKESNEKLFRSEWNLPKAAKNCGMSEKEMKLIFYEYLKYNAPDYEV